MYAWHRTVVLLLVASSWVQGQLVVENPKHLNIPEEQARALFLTTTRVMEKEFNVPGALENKFRMKLVLGEAQERFTIDDAQGNGTLYLERWNEFKFATVIMRLAVQQLLVPERQKRMLDAIAHSTHEIAPVSAAELRAEKPVTPLPRSSDGCIARMSDAGVGGVPCRLGQVGSHPVPIR